MKILEPNYTQVPNDLFNIIPMLSESEIKVLLVIIRQTIGWHKKKDRISLTQLEDKTGMSRASISGVIKSEIFQTLVKTYRTKRGNEYELIVFEQGSSKSELVQNLNHTSSKSELATSSKSEHTKETHTKETIQKNIVAPSGEVLKVKYPMPNSSNYDSWCNAIEVAELLLMRIIEWDPSHRYNVKEPALLSWVRDIDIAMRNENRDKNSFLYIIDYVYLGKGEHSEFWQGNIESGKKLRKHFVFLSAKNHYL